MKKFMEPDVNVLKFDVEDVITSSPGNEELPGANENMGELDPDQG